ncbi:hypothetical protein [Ruminococcus sp.]|uniref:hypothetical protein n=1 Tax=Ruminococcus sp. TaxID=41978 RepID=UPI001B527983|nr:hypothetical protein [Ruminococcus sp.]MBP5432285.1 hypothetical protein [Ruminococcus sp.]
MRHKKTILFSIIIISTLCFISCGKDTKDSLSSSQNTETQTSHDTSDTNITNTTKVSDDDSQGKKSSSRTMASGIGMEYFCNESPLPNMVYGHIRDNSEFGNYFFSIHKSLDEDVEYIAFVNEEGFAEDVLCWICSYEKKYVGIAKKYDSNLKDDFENWDEVLSYFGLKEGEYTNIYSDGFNEGSTTPILDKEDPDVANSCILAYSLAREYATDYSDKPAVYGIRSKDDGFIKNTLWDIPSHGDIEYIIIFDTSGNLYRVLCWDTDKDKKYVGDSELGENGDNIAELNWDDVLEKYGFKQGQYTT